jgi:hypothetical protein
MLDKTNDVCQGVNAIFYRVQLQQVMQIYLLAPPKNTLFYPIGRNTFFKHELFEEV